MTRILDNIKIEENKHRVLKDCNEDEVNLYLNYARLNELRDIFLILVKIKNIILFTVIAGFLGATIWSIYYYLEVIKSPF